MPSIDQLLAQGIQPTTPWKSPAQMAQEQANLTATQANTQARQLETQAATDALRRQEQQRQAIMRASQEALGEDGTYDPDRLHQSILTQTGDAKLADDIRASADAHKAALSKLDADQYTQRENQRKRTIGLLEGVLSQKELPRRVYTAAQAIRVAKEEGLEGLPIQGLRDDDLLTQINLLQLDGGIGARAKIERDAEIAAANEARAQAEELRKRQDQEQQMLKAPLELSKLQNEVTASVVDKETGMTRAQALQFGQGKFTADQKDYDRAVKDGAIDPKKTSFVDYQKMLANLKNPSVQVNVNGKPLAESAINKLETLAANASKLQGLKETFQDDFVGNTFTGDIENFLAGRGLDLGLATEGQFDWWQDYREFVNQVRKDLFGSALTNTEAKEFNRIIINPSMDPKVAKRNLERQAQLAQKALQHRVNVYRAGGFNTDQLGEYDQGVEPSANETPTVDVIEWEKGPDGKPRPKPKN